MTAPVPVTPAARGTPGPRFTRALFGVAMLLGAITLGSRVARGLRTGDMPWHEMSLPAAAMLGLGAVLAGPRRRALYYPLLVASFALLVAFYALPHRAPRRAAAPGGAPAGPAAGAPAPPR